MKKININIEQIYSDSQVESCWGVSLDTIKDLINIDEFIKFANAYLKEVLREDKKIKDVDNFTLNLIKAFNGLKDVEDLEEDLEDGVESFLWGIVNKIVEPYEKFEYTDFEVGGVKLRTETGRYLEVK